MSANACADPARAEIYDRLTRHFISVDDLAFRTGVCSVCGARDVAIVGPGKDGEPGPCIAQASLTFKRHAVEDGHPISASSPVKPAKRGFFSIVDTNAFVFLDAGTATVGCKVRPVEELPSGVKAVQGGNAFWPLLRAFAENPIPPMTAVFFDKKADFRIVRNFGGERFVVNVMKTEIAAERRRLLAMVAFFEEMDPADAARVMRIKKMARRRASLPPREAERLRSEFDWLAKAHPARAADLRSVPSEKEPEYQLALMIVRDAQKRRFAAQRTQTEE